MLAFDGRSGPSASKFPLAVVLLSPAPSTLSAVLSSICDTLAAPEWELVVAAAECSNSAAAAIEQALQTCPALRRARVIVPCDASEQHGSLRGLAWREAGRDAAFIVDYPSNAIAMTREWDAQLLLPMRSFSDIFVVSAACHYTLAAASDIPHNQMGSCDRASRAQFESDKVLVVPALDLRGPTAVRSSTAHSLGWLADSDTGASDEALLNDLLRRAAFQTLKAGFRFAGDFQGAGTNAPSEAWREVPSAVGVCSSDATSGPAYWDMRSADQAAWPTPWRLPAEGTRPDMVVFGASDNHFHVLVSALTVYRHVGWVGDVQLPAIVYFYQFEEPTKKYLRAHFPWVHQFRDFDFARYPPHVDISEDAGFYAWKPISLNEVLSDTADSVIWMDTGNLLGPGSLQTMRETLARDGLYSSHSTGSVRRWTHPKTLRALHAPMTSEFLSLPNCAGGVSAFQKHHPTRAYERIFQPWLACALEKECIGPKGSNMQNHRQDQAVLTVLINMEQRGEVCREWSDVKFNMTTHVVDYLSTKVRDMDEFGRTQTQVTAERLLKWLPQQRRDTVMGKKLLPAIGARYRAFRGADDR